MHFMARVSLQQISKACTQFISNLKSFVVLNLKALSHIFLIGGFQVASFLNTARNCIRIWLERDDEIFKACEEADSLASVTSILSRCCSRHYKTWVLDTKILCYCRCSAFIWGFPFTHFPDVL
jgi:hypothetical protein